MGLAKKDGSSVSAGVRDWALGITAKDVMTSEPVVVSVNDTIEDASTLMDVHLIRHLPVISGNEIVGIVSDRDISAVLNVSIGESVGEDGDGEVNLQSKVSAVCNSEVITVEPTTPLSEVVSLIIDERIGAVPVVEGTRLVGIISYVDVLKKLRESI